MLGVQGGADGFGLHVEGDDDGEAKEDERSVGLQDEAEGDPADADCVAGVCWTGPEGVPLWAVLPPAANSVAVGAASAGGGGTPVLSGSEVMKVPSGPPVAAG